MSARRMVPMVILVLLVGGGLLPGSPAQARSEAGGQVYVLHGLPGVVAQVLVDGRLRQRDVTKGAVVGPITVTAGRHEISLVAKDAAPIVGTVEVAKGGSVDVVAHLPAALDAEPVLTAFPNNLSPVGRGKTRLAVAHTAQVPPADIRVDGKPLLRNVANSEVLTVDVPARTYAVDIVPTGTTGPIVIGPVALGVKAGSLTRVFAIGSPTVGTMDVLVHTLPIAQQGAPAPAMVQTGDGGQFAALVSARG